MLEILGFGTEDVNGVAGEERTGGPSGPGRKEEKASPGGASPGGANGVGTFTLDVVEGKGLGILQAREVNRSNRLR